MLKRLVLSVVLLFVGIAGTACSQQAEEEKMTGQVHERHATGIDSQVGDN